MGRIDDVPTSVSPQSLADESPLLAGLNDPTANVSGDGNLSLQVVDTTQGQLVSEATGMNDFFSDVVGWRDATTPVLSQVVIEGRAQNNGNVIGQIVAYPVGAAPEVLTVAPIGAATSYYESGRVAQDILAGGQIREAEPPHQPWYDLRTLGPSMRDAVSPYMVLVVVLLVVGVAAAVFRLSRRRREAHSRSSA
jgi:hypothetical protein